VGGFHPRQTVFLRPNAYGNSKAAKGLLVHQRVTSICTDIIISLVSSRRQLKRRDIIDAGHKLHAEEFRYLRTVRVTAAID